MVGVCIRVCGELAYPSESLESVENSEGNVVDLQTGHGIDICMAHEPP